jgi:hypothetical protein
MAIAPSYSSLPREIVLKIFSNIQSPSAELYPKWPQTWNLDRAKAPAVRRSQVGQY